MFLIYLQKIEVVCSLVRDDWGTWNMLQKVKNARKHANTKSKMPACSVCVRGGVCCNLATPFLNFSGVLFLVVDEIICSRKYVAPFIDIRFCDLRNI